MTNEEVVALAHDAGFSASQWSVMFYDSGPYDISKPSIALQSFARLVRNAALEEAAEKLEVGVFLGGAKVIRAMKEETK